MTVPLQKHYYDTTTIQTRTKTDQNCKQTRKQTRKEAVIHRGWSIF